MPNTLHEFHNAQNSLLSSNLWKNCKKVHPKRLQFENFCTVTEIKNQKSFFCHLFIDHSCACVYATFSMWFENQHQIQRFFIYILHFFIYFIILGLFVNLKSKAYETGLENENPFYKKCKFCNHQRPERTKLLKLLYPNIHTLYAHHGCRQYLN